MKSGCLWAASAVQLFGICVIEIVESQYYACLHYMEGTRLIGDETHV